MNKIISVKFSFAKFFALVLIAGFFISCGDKDNPVDPSSDLSSKVVGTYNGRIDLKVANKEQGSVSDKSIIITKKTENTVSLKLSAFNFGKYSIPAIEAESKVTANSDGSYTLEGAVDIKGEPMNISGPFTGKLVGKDLEVTYTFQFGAMPMPVTAIFTTYAKEEPAKKEVTELKATAYDQWVYYDFSTGKSVVHSIDENVDEQSFNWDIAIHRYDIRTNGGSALETDKTDLAALTSIPAGTFTADVPDSIIVDMSNMMAGEVKYAKSSLNKVLSKWLNLDMSSMPPNYTLSNLVYVLKTKDEKYIKILFTDYTNKEGLKGYISFSYEYMTK
ncbi:MAG: hypothetical protein GX372_02095 [Ignavibacteria bacterium]|jgi:hypothetical protein|nr:hypothetical protein [Ignavibacteria bacterium]